jgi:hypothetical protein
VIAAMKMRRRTTTTMRRRRTTMRRRPLRSVEEAREAKAASR